MQLSNKLKAFIAYSRADKLYFKLLKKGIFTHSNGMTIEWDVWEDTQIPVGTNWNDFIQEKVKTCDFAILLISGNFLCSEYINTHELKEFIIRDCGNGFFTFPILIDPCNFKRNPELSQRQFFACSGDEYGLPNIPDLTYADLVRICDDGQILPNPNRERYHMNLVAKIEEAIKLKRVC
jgi:hypothetical protein